MGKRGNELRRVTEKLKTLTDTENISWIISDILNISTSGNISPEEVEGLIQKLKETYLMYISRNRATPPTQKELNL